MTKLTKSSLLTSVKVIEGMASNNKELMRKEPRENLEHIKMVA